MKKHIPQNFSCSFYVYVVWGLFTGTLFHPVQAIEVEELVDTGSPAYAEYAQILMKLTYAHQEIDGDIVDPQVVAKRKSKIEEDYIEELIRRGNSYYRGDDLWYYRAIKKPESLDAIALHPVHGLCYSQLGDRSSIDTLKLKNPFVHLLSFNPVRSIRVIAGGVNIAAALNAAAVEEQVKKGWAVTSAETRRLAEKYLGEPFSRNFGGKPTDLAAEWLKLSRDRLFFLDKEKVRTLPDFLNEKEYRVLTALSENDFLTVREPAYYVFDSGRVLGIAVWYQRSKRYQNVFLDQTNSLLSKEDDCVLLLKYIDDLYVRLQVEEALNSADPQSMKKLEDCFTTDGLHELIKAMCQTADRATHDTFYAKCGADSEHILGKRQSVSQPLKTQSTKNSSSLLIGFCGIVAIGLLMWLKRNSPADTEQQDDEGLQTQIQCFAK